MQPKKDFRYNEPEWRDNDGSFHQLCIVEELDVANTESAPAIITFGGFSLCREHFEKVTGLIKAGLPMSEIVRLIMTDGLDADKK